MYKVGDIIRFRYTGLRGEVVENYLDGSYAIAMDDGDEIVGFTDDIIHDVAFVAVEKSPYQKQQKKKQIKKDKPLSTEEIFYGKSNFDQMKKDKLLAPLKNQQQKQQAQPSKSTPKKAVTETPSHNYWQAQQINPQAPSNKGLFVAFLQQEYGKYVMYLVHDTPNSFNFKLEVFFGDFVEHQFSHHIPTHDYFPVGELVEEDISDSPRIKIELPVLNYTKEIKIRRKKFVSTAKEAPLLGVETQVFPVFEGKNPPKKSNLRAYTQKHIAERKKEEAEEIEMEVETVKIPHLIERVNFKPEIDLHLESLVENPKDVPLQEILPLQLNQLEKFIDKALIMKAKRITIIHGVGDGVLRRKVRKVLIENKLVLKVLDGYHQGYGFGATKVDLDV